MSYISRDIKNKKTKQNTIYPKQESSLSYWGFMLQQEICHLNVRGDNHKHQYKDLSKFLPIRKRNWKTWATKMFYPTKTMEQLTHKSTNTSINTSTSATHMGQTVGSIQSKSGLSSRWHFTIFCPVCQDIMSRKKTNKNYWAHFCAWVLLWM